MNREENRLQTFSEWPSDSVVDPQRIAKAGFFYTRNNQTVECFSCQTQISEWNYGDQVMARHRAQSPQCAFVQDPLSTDNVPLISGTSSNSSDLTDVDGRLSTFENWPSSDIVTPETLARSGFYYLQEADRTQCAYCHGIIMSWEAGDVPDLEHQRHFPRCSFVNSVIKPRLAAGNTENTIIPGINDNGDSLNLLGVYMHQGPKHARYSTVNSRLRTFATWPADLIQTPDTLAEAGFFYEGISDQVRCFHCDGGLRNWDPVDDPWTEHARWFPSCSFVKLIKGQEFVEACAVEVPSEEPSGPTTHTQKGRSTGSNVVPRREITEQELQEHMTNPVVLAALEIGLNVERVKRAIKEKLEQTGRSFSQADALVEAALSLQHDEDDTVTETDDSSIVTRHIRPHVPRVRHNTSPSTDKTPSKSISVDTSGSSGERSSTKPVSLEEENRILKEARLCKICMDIEVGIVFLPCGHLATCVNCATNLELCPVCRSAIKATVRTFLA